MEIGEWWSPILKHGLWVAAMAVVMGWLARSRLKARTLAETRRLEYSTSFMVLAVICVVFFGACAILSNVYPDSATSRGTTAIFVGFALLSVCLVLECIIARHWVSETGLIYRRWPGTRHSLQWQDLASVRYAPVMKWFRLETKSGEVARISAMLTGLPEFAHLLLTHAPGESIEDETLPILHHTANGRPPSIWM